MPPTSLNALLKVPDATRAADAADSVQTLAVAFDECSTATLSEFGHLVPDAATAAPLRSYERTERRGDHETTLREARWLTIFRVEEAGRGQAPVRRPLLQSRTSLFGRADDGVERRVSVTEYAVDEDGGYRRMDGDGDDRRPSGPTQDAVHLVIRTPYDHRPRHVVRLTRHPLPAMRIEDLADRLRRTGVLPHATTLDLSGWSLAGPVVAANDEGPALVRVRLVETLRWVRSLLDPAERAFADRRTWYEKLRGAGQLAALLGAPCYDGRHGRSHLQEQLVLPHHRDGGSPWPAAGHDDPPRLVASAYAMDGEDTWGSFSLREATGDATAPEEPEGRELLAHFRYGFRCKEALLTQNLRERIGRVEEALLSRPYRAALRDAVGFDAQAAKALGVSGLEQDAARGLALPIYRLTAIGGGSAFSTHVLGKSGIMQQVEGSVRSPDDLDRLLEPVAEIDEKPAEHFLDENSRFRLLLKVARQSADAQYALVAGMAAAVTAWRFQTSFQTEVPPRGPALVAALLLRASGWKNRPTYSVRSKSGAVELRGAGGTVILSKLRLTEVDHHVPVRGVVWRLNVQGEIRADVGAAARSMGLSAHETGRVATYLDIVNVAVATAALFREGGDRDAAADILALVQILVGGAEAIRHGVPSHSATRSLAMGMSAATMARPVAGAVWDGAIAVGKRLVRLGPHVEVAAAAFDAYRNVMDRDAVGRMTVSDPNYIGALGAISMGVGIALMTTGPIGAGALALGSVLLGGGAAAQLWNERTDRLRSKTSDPLWDWLPQHSLWGKTPRAQRGERDRLRGVLFDLVRPGAVDDAPRIPDDLARRMGEEAQSFLETAYWFPVQVHVGHRSGLSTKDIVPNRLRLDIAYGFLPSVGTLTVNVRLVPSASEFEPVDRRFTLHYAEVDDRLRYRVCRDGEVLDVSRNVPVTQWVKGEEWPVGKTRAVRLPDGRGGEGEHLSVYLGDWWRRDGRLRDRSGENERGGVRPDNTRVSRRGVHDVIHPLAFLDRSDSLRQVLGGGAFAVTGTVLFQPLRPFDPEARVQAAPIELAAVEDIRFVYPGSRQD